MNHREYRQSFAQKKPKETVFCLLLLAVSLLLYALASFFSSFSLVGKILAVVFLILFIQITNQFLLTDLSYFFQNGNLFLITKQGKKEKRVGSLELDSDCRFFEEKEWKQAKKEYRIQSRFSYCGRLFHENNCYLLCSSPEGQILLRFQPDETMADLIRSCLEEK